MIKHLNESNIELIFYIPIVILIVFLISLSQDLFVKVLIASIPSVIAGIVYLIRKPSNYLIAYFFLSPLAHPVFLEQLPYTTIEVIAMPTLSLGIFSIFSSWDKESIKIFLQNRHFFIAILLMVFFGLISTLANIGRVAYLVGTKSFILENTAKLIGRPILYGIILFLGLRQFKRDRYFNYLLVSILFSAFLVGAFNVFVTLTGKPYWAFDLLTLRVKGTFPVYNALGAYSALMIFYVLGFRSISKNNLIRIICSITIILSIIGLITARTLGSILGVIGGTIVYNIFNKHGIRNILIFIVSGLLISLTASFLYPQIFAKLAVINERFLDRIIVNYTGIKVIIHNFWFGVGTAIEQYMVGHPHIISTPWGTGGSVPHNFLLTAFAKGGIFYCGGLIYLVFAIFKKIKDILPEIKKSKNNSFYYALLGGLTAFFIQANTNQLFFNIRLGIYVILFTAFIIKLQREGDFSFSF